MNVFAALDSPTLLGLAAAISALGGLFSTIMAMRKDRSEEHEKCLERLREARTESESLAKELHERKMRDDGSSQ
jgi:hypothetical protein